MAEIEIAFEQLNNPAEETISLSGQPPEISEKQMFNAHWHQLVAEFPTN